MEDHSNFAANKEPLLPKEVNGNCPGCNTAYLREPGGRPPKLVLLAVGLLSLLNALPLTSVYPFLYFMIHDFHIAKSNDSVGYYVGLVGSSCMVGRFLTAAFWGVIADRYGRKLVIYIGVISIIIFNFLFGLSTNFWMALASRFFLGVFNGMMVSIQAYASEICSHEHQPFVFSVISTTWGIGLVIGPSLGGYLSQPAIKYPKLFTNPIFERFPYALPCLFISVYAVSLLAITSQMPETVHKHSHKVDEDCISMCKDETMKDEIRKDGVLDSADASVDKDTPQLEHKIVMHEQKNYMPHKSLYKNWGLIASIAIYCIWSMHDVAYIEIFSLWAVSPQRTGGLSLTSSGVGKVLAISGVCVLFFQMVLFPPVSNFLGPIGVARGASMLSIPLLAAYPYISTLNVSWSWAAIIIASILKSALSVAVYTAAYLLMNNSVTQDQRGAANGLSMSAMSISVAVGPAGGGALFAWSQTRLDAAFLPGEQIVFFFVGMLALVTCIATFEPFLPQSVNKQIVEPHQSAQDRTAEPLQSTQDRTAEPLLL
ncbi:hypothetical protein O6H91_09G002600 [Diphasiastrum complanatum]|uniref:Uncharacterized protein n=3 Tax=Diphasiastrum complanatum TaxID=34168 RepID=A0ACC2CKV3_DIPCM|nr:hypothetical protein O6H91_09G002600 [Diphasiastrum complanatum]KAJ7542607.1 hypothetical protein O6H91_09G002600 [Diphasiastrum complanatum]KAJ7542608.1 hypothetical protein O6H91_09G002600 [Diphasiastrum complanatum]